MKNKFLPAAAAFFWIVLITSCKKEDATSLSANTSDVDNAYIETSLPIQTSITHTVDANIGGFLQALPAHYDNHPGQRYPLIIFLHGSGETGDGSQSSLQLVAKHSIPQLIAAHQFPANFTIRNNLTYQFIVLSPQFKQWPQPSDINDMYNYAVSHYRVDFRKIYIVGLSMGGGGAWDYSWNYGKNITGMVTMAGASYPTSQKAQLIAQDSIAVWAFHNTDDPTVPSFYSVDYVQYINNYDPYIPAKLTLWTSNVHDCWTEASDPNYKENGMNIYEWMLSYIKKNKKK